MSLLSRLFGGKAGNSPDPELYEGFAIYPEPVNEGGRWRIAARIEKEVGAELKTHQLIRADTLEDQETAVRESTAKAKVLIDEQGERIFR